MLQKIHWLRKNQHDLDFMMQFMPGQSIQSKQELRSIFCKTRFVFEPFHSPDFSILDGDLISSSYSWIIAVNNLSVFSGGGSAITPVDEIVAQIRRFLILRLNLFLGDSPDTVGKASGQARTASDYVAPQKILPDLFSQDTKFPHVELETLESWFQKILSFPRQEYKDFCKALAAYERALQILATDPALSYAMLVFAIESLANGHSSYQASWDDISGSARRDLDTLITDQRVSRVEESWLREFQDLLVRIMHPGATKRFTKFALDHIPTDFYLAKNSKSKFPIRYSRIRRTIQNAYLLRSSFAHSLKPLNEALIIESYRAEEIELDYDTYPTLRGLFRLTRAILLSFIELQDRNDLSCHPWSNEDSSKERGIRISAYARMKKSNGKLHRLTIEHSKFWLEDIYNGPQKLDR